MTNISSESPLWLQLLQISVGVVSIILSSIVLAYPSLGVFTVILMLAITLLIVGIERVASGIFSPFLGSKLSRLSNIGLGVIVIVFALISVAYPPFAVGILIALVAFALLFNGVARIVYGIAYKNAPKWSRAFRFGVGVLCIALSILVISSPTFGIILLGLIISIALLVNGIELIASGLTGRRFLFQ
jgi:uncharacterized membrane protein HdeD (DUF308 family)